MRSNRSPDRTHAVTGTPSGWSTAALQISIFRVILFLATAAPHFALGVYGLVRARIRPPVPVAEREAFKTLPAERAVTPQAGLLDPRSEQEGDNGNDPEAMKPAAE